jgi:uncharacterized protein
VTEGHAAAVLTEEQIDRLLQGMADSFAQQLRAPILHSPAEQGLDYQDVTFPALDGVPLEGWFIPGAGSDKLIIANHPMGFSRAGIPAHLEPWRSIWAPSGNDFEVNLVPDYKILHDAGTACWPTTCATSASAVRPIACWVSRAWLWRQLAGHFLAVM